MERWIVIESDVTRVTVEVESGDDKVGDADQVAAFSDEGKCGDKLAIPRIVGLVV